MKTTSPLLVAVVVLAATTTIRAQLSAAPQGPPGGRFGGVPPPPPPDPAAVERGRQAFTENCASCHGADGRGGNFGATDLTLSAMTIANDGGRQLSAFLKIGRPEARMPSFALADTVVADLSAFLRSRVVAAPAAGRGGFSAAAIVVGDAKAGEKYFSTVGCAKCHSATDDLKGIGARYDVATIQGRAVMPRGSGGYPRGFSSPPDPNEVPKTVTITQPSGEKLSGKLMWITDFNVTFTDAAGVRRTVARHGEVPRVEVTDPLQWHIDHMKKLTDKDMHDLTAYLVTLR